MCSTLPGFIVPLVPVYFSSTQTRTLKDIPAEISLAESSQSKYSDMLYSKLHTFTKNTSSTQYQLQQCINGGDRFRCVYKYLYGWQVLCCFPIFAAFLKANVHNIDIDFAGNVDIAACAFYRDQCVLLYMGCATGNQMQSKITWFCWLLNIVVFP